MSDIVSSLLNMMRVRGTAYIGKNLKEPWSMSIEEHTNLARFHLILSGSTWIEIPATGQRERLNKGDFVIIPNGKGHILSDQAGRKSLVSAMIPSLEYEPSFEHVDTDRDVTHVLCGYFQVTQDAPPAIMSRLPEVLVMRRNNGPQTQNIELIIEFVCNELKNNSGPATVVLNRLTEILCLYAIHNWVDQAMTEVSEFRALADPKLHQVLDALQSRPMEAWTVESLANIYGQSRTAFATHFKATLGLSPITYVTQWRVTLARKMLEDSNLSLDEIAMRVGYADTNAFNRAFKRETGVSLAAFRRAASK